MLDTNDWALSGYGGFGAEIALRGEFLNLFDPTTAPSVTFIIFAKMSLRGN